MLCNGWNSALANSTRNGSVLRPSQPHSGMPLIAFHVEDQRGRPLGGALITAKNEPLGNWAGITNPCGDFLATLGAGRYELTITHPGFHARTLPADLADSGVVTIGLEPGSVRARTG